jgi:hypothetical protein
MDERPAQNDGYSLSKLAFLPTWGWSRETSGGNIAPRFRHQVRSGSWPWPRRTNRTYRLIVQPIPIRRSRRTLPLVHLSVAIGRFFEALLWALARSVGMVAAWVVLGAIAIALVFVLIRAGLRRR